MKEKKELILEDLESTLREFKSFLEKHTSSMNEKENRLYDDIITQLKLENKRLKGSIFKLRNTNEKLLKEIDGLQYSLNLYSGSKSWKVTLPLRKLSFFIRNIKKLINKLMQNPELMKKGISSIRKHGFKHSINKIRAMISEQPFYNSVGVNFDLNNQDKVFILTTRHCLYIANLIKDNLKKIDISADIIFEKPKFGFGKGLHFVICPQMFNELPEAYVAYQLEQSVSSRWFTDDYINRLENSYAIFDYSLSNIDFLQKKGLYYQQIYFMPVDYNSSYESRYPNNEDEEYDVLFYGDVNNDRRKSFLSALGQKFKVKIVSEVFGEKLYKELKKAKIIVNIHYYEDALLETTRLFECLSLGKMIVSETSSDINEHKSLANCIDFVPINDIEAMCERVSYWLENPDERKKKITDNINVLNFSSNWFEYYFMRFMLANDWISFEEFYQIVGKHVQFKSDFVCLGLPESTERMRDFQKDNHYKIDYFPGLRHRKGWIGCGLSYKFMFRKAKEQKFNILTICEDDVEFKSDFEKSYNTIKNYLYLQNNWDLFSGVIADLHDNVRVKKIDKDNYNEYIYLDKMTSMVMNIYSSRFFDKVIQWDESDHDVSRNAIDRYIESSSNVTTITTLPYLVGHKEQLNSTLWGFQNDVYSEMIKKSELHLKEKVKIFKEHTY